MSLPSTNGIFIHDGHNCSPNVVPTAQSIQMSASDTTTVNSALNNKMDKTDPIGTGSLSLNRSGTTGTQSVATGYNCIASGNYSNAGNYATTASGNYSHAEGFSTISNGYATHAEGNATTASNSYSHAEGQETAAIGNNSHAEGEGTIAQRKSQHVFGEYNTADTGGTDVTTKGNYIEVVGNGSDNSSRSNARTLDWSGNEVLAGDLTINGSTSVGSTLGNKMDKANPVGTGSFSLNRSGATGTESVSIGHNCVASGTYSYAEGVGTISNGYTSHAEGYQTISSGYYTHAEGWQTTASGTESHAEGDATQATGDFSHTEGKGTIAQRRSQHVFGEFNDPDTGGTGITTKGTYIEIVGKGANDVSRSNARTLDWSGNEVLAGGLTINGNQAVIPTGFSGTATKISAWSNTTGSANIAIATSSGRQFVITINSSGVISGSVIDPT